MSDPVTDVEGINYERKNIEQWLQTQPQIGKSPASGKPLTKENLWSNRELKNIIEEMAPNEKITYLHHGNIIQFRFEVTLRFLCNIGQEIDPRVIQSIRTRVQEVKIYNWWPALNENAQYISELTWYAFSELREKVYVELVQIKHPATAYVYETLKKKVDGTIKDQAKACFIKAMTDHFQKSKPDQMEHAARLFRRQTQTTENNKIDNERKRRWREWFHMRSEPEPPPAPPINYYDVYRPQIPRRQAYHDFSQAHGHGAGDNYPWPSDHR